MPGRKLILLAMLIAVGLWLLAGCIYIPKFNAAIEGTTNASNKVGDATSSEPLRVNASTREDVLRLLGPLHYGNEDRTQVAYSWGVTNGIWVGPICAAHQLATHVLVLDYDGSGVLRSYHLVKGKGTLWDAPEMPQLPSGMHPYPLARPTTTTAQ